MFKMIKIPITKIGRTTLLYGDEKKRFDTVFLIAVLLVTLYGTLVVFSAGTAYAEARYGDTYYFVKKQTVWLLIGFAVMYFASNIKIEIFKKCITTI